MSKAKEGLSISNVVDLHKPLVKDYVDPDLAVDNFLKLRLPHFPYSTAICKLLYRSKDGNVVRYRVNWWRVDNGASDIVTTGKIVHSASYQISTTKEGYELREL